MRHSDESWNRKTWKTEALYCDVSIRVQNNYSVTSRANQEVDPVDFLFVSLSKDSESMFTTFSREQATEIRDHLTHILGDEQVADDIESSVADDMDNLFEALRAKGWSMDAAERLVNNYFKGGARKS